MFKEPLFKSHLVGGFKKNRSNIFGGMRLVQKRKHEKRNTSEVDDGKGGETLSSIPARDPLLNLRE